MGREGGRELQSQPSRLPWRVVVMGDQNSILRFGFYFEASINILIIL